MGSDRKGKVKQIKFVPSSNKNNLKFVYGPMDMRVMKIEYLNNNTKLSKRTYYSYDAQGKVLSTYYKNVFGFSEIPYFKSEVTDTQYRIDLPLMMLYNQKHLPNVKSGFIQFHESSEFDIDFGTMTKYKTR